MPPDAHIDVLDAAAQRKGAFAVAIAARRVLLVQLAGGLVDHGETPPDAVIRECANRRLSRSGRLRRRARGLARAKAIIRRRRLSYRPERKSRSTARRAMSSTIIGWTRQASHERRPPKVAFGVASHPI